MQAIADHVYHILIIAFVAATIVEAIAKVAKRPRKRKRKHTLNAPRETVEQREQRMREHYEAFGARWSEWLAQPRGHGDAARIVTAARIWGAPERGAAFPRRFHDAQLGKVMLDKRSYLAMLDAPVRSSASFVALRASARARAKWTACVGCPPRPWSWEPSPYGTRSAPCATSLVWLPRGRLSPMP